MGLVIKKKNNPIISIITIRYSFCYHALCQYLATTPTHISNIVNIHLGEAILKECTWVLCFALCNVCVLETTSLPESFQFNHQSENCIYFFRSHRWYTPMGDIAFFLHPLSTQIRTTKFPWLSILRIFTSRDAILRICGSSSVSKNFLIATTRPVTLWRHWMTCRIYRHRKSHFTPCMDCRIWVDERKCTCMPLLDAAATHMCGRVRMPITTLTIRRTKGNPLNCYMKQREYQTEQQR